MLNLVNMPSLLQGIRVLSDRRHSNFLNDEELTDLVRDSFQELYNDILTLKTGFLLKQNMDELSVVEGNKIMFPSDFYKLILLEQKYGPENYIPLREKTLEEVSQVSNSYFSGYLPSVFGYVMFDEFLKVYPETGNEGYRFRLSYGRDLDISSD